MKIFSEGLKSKLEFVNNALNELDLSNVHQALRVPTKYSLLGSGKRLRPLLCMLCTELVGGDYEETKNAFLALELIHNGTLIHDDIIDEDLFRRGGPAVHVKFGLKQAVLTGDALLSLGLKYAAITGNIKIVELLSETSLKMLQGVALQTLNRRKIVSEEEYLYINYLKSGSLFEASAALGGLIGSSNIEDPIKLAEFGKNFGNAYQIRDDICSTFIENWDDDLSRNDLLNGDISLPFIYALESNTIRERDKNMLISLYLGHSKQFSIDELQRIYEESGALAKSTGKMKEFAEDGRRYLKGFEKNHAYECINFMLDQYYRYFSSEERLKIVI